MNDFARWFEGAEVRPEAECWQVRQVGEPSMPRPGPTASPAIGFWFNRLRDRKRPTPYQICLAMHIAEASRRR